ncbi:TPA: hypothetical protein ACILGD_002737, partial [Enterococcus faecium]
YFSNNSYCYRSIEQANLTELLTIRVMMNRTTAKIESVTNEYHIFIQIDLRSCVVITTPFIS